MSSQLNEYLTRENEKKNLKSLFENKQLSLEDARYYVNKLNLTEEEFNEIFEGLGAKLKAGWKTLTGRGEEGRAEYAEALKKKQAAEYGKTGGIGSMAKAAFGTAKGKAQAAAIDAQIAAKEAALAKTPQGPAQEAIQKDLEVLRQKREGITTEFGAHMAKAGAAQAEKAAAGQAAVDTKVAKILSKNVVAETDRAIGGFNTEIATATSQDAVKEAATKMVTAIAQSINNLYQKAGFGEPPRGVL